MSYSFEEIGNVVVTFPDGGCAVDAVCKLDSTGTAVYCSSGDKFIGVARTVWCEDVGVQLHGFAQVRYTGSTAPVPGYVNLVANGIGGVKVDNSGRAYLVVQVNTEDKTLTMEL